MTPFLLRPVLFYVLFMPKSFCGASLLFSPFHGGNRSADCEQFGHQNNDMTVEQWQQTLDNLEIVLL